MKRTYFLKAKQALVAVMVAAAAMFTACSDNGEDVDGPDDPNKKPSVEATQLADPNAESIEFTRGEGAETAPVTLTWAAVANADAYNIVVTKVGQLDDNDDLQSTNENVLTVDATDDLTTSRRTVDFTATYGGQYKVTLKALGDGEKYTDSNAVEATWLWYVPANVLEAGDVAAQINAAVAAAAEGEELQFALLVGETYTLDSAVDFGCHKTEVYTVALNDLGVAKRTEDRAVVTFGAAGMLFTAAGLNLNNVNFDCTAQELAEKPNYGFITMTNNAELFAARLTQAMAGDNVLYLDAQNPIVVKNCNIKNMPGGFLSIGLGSWAIDQITVDNCIMQFNSKVTCEFLNFNPGSAYGFIDATNQSWRGNARNVEITNTTIYNIADAKARIYNAANADLKRHFPEETGSFTMKNVTLHSYAESYDNSFNNTGKVEGYKVNLNDCVFYNLININKFKSGSADYSGTDPKTNVIYHKWRVDNNQSAWSLNGMGEPNESEELFASCVEIDFTGTTPSELDLTDNVKGGQNFKYSVGTGDPRWK